jgi:hypothetical protein
MLKKDKELGSEPTRLYITIALLVGILMIVVSSYFDHPHLVEMASALCKEFGIVLVSVWGVSLFYEKFLAERHFTQFYQHMRDLMSRGASNAAVCESLGILEIHQTRRSYEETHSFRNEIEKVGAKDSVRISGRSLIFTIYRWEQLQVPLIRGATLQLCMCDPSIKDSPLEYLAGYSTRETELAIDRLSRSVKPWLTKESPPGTLEIRFHAVHLLDSLLEIRGGDLFRMAWDLNFGEGIEQRQVFYLDGNGPLGRNLLRGRYELLWLNSTTKFLYRNGEVAIDKLDS